MKRLLNTLYVTGKNRYLSLDGENVVISDKQEEIGRIPLHNLQGIVTFGYTGASPALMGVCAERNIELTFMSGNGRFLAGNGPHGNPLYDYQDRCDGHRDGLQLYHEKTVY